MKKGKSAGHPRPNNQMKKSPGPNKNNLKEKKAKSPLKFVNDLKNKNDAKPLVKKLLGQGKEVKSPGASPKKHMNKKRNKNKGKKGPAPTVNPDKDNAVTEDSSDEEMNEDNSEGLESSANSPKKTDKKKKLGLLEAKNENKENGDNEEDDDDDSVKDTANKEKGKPKHPKKFCLFVGNLPYEVKEDEVREHFKSLKDGIKAVRLMTDKKTGKGKGFCFVEVHTEVAYKAAMKMNKQKMGERVVRVEYTTPGKSDNKGRKKFIHNKTKKLLGQKKQKKGKGFNKKKGKGKK